MSYFPKVRPRIQREFITWYTQQAQTFILPLYLTEHRDGWLKLSQPGLHPAIIFSLTKWELTVAAVWQNRLWDYLATFEVGAKVCQDGYFCTMCLKEHKTTFPTRTALWQDHLFAPFRDWLNDTLFPARYLSLYQINDDADSSWAKLLLDAADHTEGERECTAFVFPLWLGTF